MKSRGIVRAVTVLLAATAIVLSAQVAFAATPNLPTEPFKVNSGGRILSTPSLGQLITSEGVVQTATINGWVASMNTAPRNARQWLDTKRKTLGYTSSRVGYTVLQPQATNLIAAELRAEVASPSVSSLPVVLPTNVTKPKIAKLGKTILVRLSQTKIYLWSNGKVEKTYRCAIGMRRYPTPTGTFRIGRKVKMPTWTNPGGRWGVGLPASYPPGPSNPLGTRALYVYKGKRDTGVRFHGTTHVSSIGHAQSHGCLRMKRADVENFYPRVPVGTTVYIIK